jgi:hypothetical protein
MYRQGDVLIVVVEEIPADARRAPDCVLARGEATGHSHRIESGAEQFVTPDGDRYIRVDRDVVALVHEEHGTVHLTGPAAYRVHLQREYRPAGPGTVRD